MSYYLGMDGGGTKTAFLLIDGSGTPIASSKQSSSYYFDEGIELLERVLRAGLAEVTQVASITPAEIDFAFFGVPGFGEASGDVERIDDIARKALGHGRYQCGNDMIGGWAGSLGGEDGINVIAGTGSMAYGERGGIGQRVGGWSEVFADEGSAHWIGIAGLNAFSRMADGRMTKGPLYDLMRERVGVTHDLDLIGVVVSEWGAKRTSIADLAKVVMTAADLGDPHASRILLEATEELVELVVTLRGALGFQPDEIAKVSYSGGMFSAPSFLAAFAAGLSRTGQGYQLVTPHHTPDLGSALYALKLSGANLPLLPATA